MGYRVKNKINFFVHLPRMNFHRLTQQAFDSFPYLKTKPDRFKEIEEGLRELRIKENSLLDRTAKIIRGDETTSFIN